MKCPECGADSENPGSICHLEKVLVRPSASPPIWTADHDHYDGWSICPDKGEGIRRHETKKFVALEDYSALQAELEKCRGEATATINEMQNIICKWVNGDSTISNDLRVAYNLGAKYNSENCESFNVYLEMKEKIRALEKERDEFEKQSATSAEVINRLGEQYRQLRSLAKELRDAVNTYVLHESYQNFDSLKAALTRANALLNNTGDKNE